MMLPLLIISRYAEKVDWLMDFPYPYHIVYNKGEDNLPSWVNSVRIPNFGGNQYDIFKFIFDNYDELPERMAFLQAYPFDHCNCKRLVQLLASDSFASLESYEDKPVSDAHKKDHDGGYLEINNNWYIAAHNGSHNLTCRHHSLDAFMGSIFKNYTHLPWVRFAPGSQYLVPRELALSYSKRFWEYMMNSVSHQLGKNGGTEGHVVERSLWYVFTKRYEVVENLK